MSAHEPSGALMSGVICTAAGGANFDKIGDVLHERFLHRTPAALGMSAQDYLTARVQRV